MGKRRLLTNVLVGAAVGGLISLFNKDARNYVKKTVQKSSNSVVNYVKNPLETVQQVKQSAQTLNEKVDENVSGAVNTLDIVEQSLEKIFKK